MVAVAVAVAVALQAAGLSALLLESKFSSHASPAFTVSPPAFPQRP